MKKYSRWIVLCSVLFVSFCILPGKLMATDPGDGTVTDPDAPIDGGIGLLVAAGVGYGYKKYRNKRNNKPVSLNGQQDLFKR